MPLVPQVPADSGKRFSFRFSSDYNTSNARGVSVLNPILTDPQPTFPTRIMDFVSSLVPSKLVELHALIFSFNSHFDQNCLSSSCFVAIMWGLMLLAA